MLKCLTLPASEFQKEGAKDFSALLCEVFTLKIVLNLVCSFCFCTTALWHPRKALKGRKKTKSSQETLELALTPGSDYALREEDWVSINDDEFVFFPVPVSTRTYQVRVQNPWSGGAGFERSGAEGAERSLKYIAR